ncbi:MAG: hypothetical protein FWD61_19070 [Phycisphaerales bacterium]|nr:hypothetical protein [Phycisphaerales bacterium]
MNRPFTPLPPIRSPKLVSIKRRILPIASTATAALALTSCGIPERLLCINPLFPSDSTSHPTVSPTTAPGTESQVDAYADAAAAALQKYDLEKLKSARSKSVPAFDQQGTPPTSEVILATTHNPSPPSLLSDLATLMADPLPMQLSDPDGLAGVTTSPSLAPTTSSPATATIVASVGPSVFAKNQESSIVQSPLSALEPTPEAALEVLRKQAAARPTLSNALALALLDQAAGGGSRPRDTSLSQRLNAVDQQIYQDLLASLENLDTTAIAPLADRVAPIVEATQKWQTEADIALPKLVLATRVDSYGVYTPIDAKFKAGEKHTAIIYCEVANFTVKKSGDNWYETRLSQQETLATDDGLLLWRPNPEVVEDRSMNQRRDFYLVKKITIPDNLAVGKYALRMSVTDLNTNKIAVVNLPIEITK